MAADYPARLDCRSHRRDGGIRRRAVYALAGGAAQAYVLDDYTVGRVITVFTAQQEDLWLFDEQLRRWAAETLTPRQRTEVDRLLGQMRRLHEVIIAILRLAEELKAGTIERQLAKSDLELGIEALRNRWPTDG